MLEYYEIFEKSFLDFYRLAPTLEAAMLRFMLSVIIFVPLLACLINGSVNRFVSRILGSVNSFVSKILKLTSLFIPQKHNFLMAWHEQVVFDRNELERLFRDLEATRSAVYFASNRVSEATEKMRDMHRTVQVCEATKIKKIDMICQKLKIDITED